ncbi:MAG: histidine kinase, partial [Flavobacteriales bacterium]|nr:histidine kinase [Flavobacteriales bacterium]
MILLTFLIPITGIAQRMDACLKEFITVDNGLPSNEVYFIHQDQNNYIWFATDNGIVKYDGNTFRVFNTNDGLPNNTVFRFYEQPNGKLYGEALYNKYFFIENDQAYPYRHNNLIESTLPTQSRSHSFYIDSLSNTYIGSTYGSMVIDSGGEVIQKGVSLIAISCVTTTFQCFGDYVFTYAAGQNSELNCTINQNFSNGETRHYKTVSYSKKSAASKYATKMDDGQIAIMHQSNVHIVTDSVITGTLSTHSGTIGLFSIDSLLWVCTTDHGVYVYQITEGQQLLVDHLLDGYSVTSVLKDRESGYWFSTRERGVVHIYDQDLIEVYKAPEDQNISIILPEKENIFIGFDNGDLTDLYTKGPLISLSTQMIGIHRIDSSSLFLETNVALTSMHFINDAKSDKVISNIAYGDQHLPEQGIDFFSALIRNGVLHHTKRTFGFIQNKKSAFIFDRHLIKDRVSDALIYNGQVCLGTSKGLCFISKDGLSVAKRIDLPSAVMGISAHKNGLILGCRSGNIYTWNGEDIKILNLLEHANASSIQDLIVAGNLLVIATNQGIHKFNYDKETEAWQKYEFTDIKGVISIKSVGSELYYSTKKKIFKDENQRRNTVLPSTRITGFSVNGLPEPFHQTDPSVLLNYSQNNIKFEVTSISFGSNFRTYRYQLVGADEQYSYTTNPTINFSALSPGAYEFLISSSLNGVNYSPDKHFGFTIQPPFWKTAWFITIVTVLILSLLLFLVIQQHRKAKAKLLLHQTMTQLKSQALRSQLNPHLVFNVLNSIQGLISEEDPEKANQYLSKCICASLFNLRI